MFCLVEGVPLPVLESGIKVEDGAFVYFSYACVKGANLSNSFGIDETHGDEADGYYLKNTVIWKIKP